MESVLAVGLPLVCVVALVLVRPGGSEIAQPGSAEQADLTSASVVCPSALSDDDGVGVGALTPEPDAAASGEVTVGLGSDTSEQAVEAGRVAALTPGPDAAVVSTSGELASGLVASRSSTRPLAALDCPPPVPDQWFTAVGSGAGHTSALELVNPNPGPAVADVVVHGRGGVVDVPGLRGITIPGASSRRLDLASIVPRRGDLALEVRTSRGRVAAALRDSFDELGAGGSAQDWLPAQGTPTRRNLLLGTLAGPGSRTLVLANPSDDEVRADLKVVTADSVFAPEDVESIRVAPGSTARVSLDDLVASAAKSGAIGLRVDSSGPLTATLRQFVGGDLSLLVPGQAVASATAVVVPRGAKRLLLAGADGVGVATVVARGAGGKKLMDKRVELVPDAGADVELPPFARLVEVSPERTSVRGSVLATGKGAAVVRLRELVRSSPVPDVGPGLP